MLTLKAVALRSQLQAASLGPYSFGTLSGLGPSPQLRGTVKRKIELLGHSQMFQRQPKAGAGLTINSNSYPKPLLKDWER